MQVFKKLEVFGFKSFADKLEVDFRGGVTCIVGPNGCGKSNVSDAIRWVLGEQSSKILRGSQMQDVIFKGTETRAGLGYCEVSLHFDNTSGLFPVDYSDVVISRKLYKSGESEYLINRSPARLKDITNLLHDSGIDRDGFTIISQGQVGEIISSKPESRRGIFEEAAGISKFKSRKVEAEKKLERTSMELVRVTDVINEIERTLKPLIRQAEAAQRYVVLRDRLKWLEINAYVTQYDNAAADKEKLQVELDTIDRNLRAKQQQVEEQSQQSAAEMVEIRDIDSKSEQLRAQVLDLSVFLEREQNESKMVSMERLNELKLERAQLVAKKRTIENLIESGEGYKFAVKKILEAKKNAKTKFQQAELETVIGIVAQELVVPDYLESAIEVALGAAAQNIITQDEAGAQNMIDLLKQNNWGRATFLPLTSAKPRTLTYEEVKECRNYDAVGVASDLVTYNKQIKPVVEALLGRIVIVEDLDDAIDLARSTRYAFKIVTLDGDVIETRGSITGGSKNALNNNLWHTNNLAQIEKSLLDLDAQMATLEQEAGGDKQNELSGKYFESLAKLNTAKKQLASLAERKEHLRSGFSEQEQEKNALTEQISNLTRQYYRTEAALARVDVNIEQMQTRIDEEYGMNYSACHLFLQEKNSPSQGARCEQGEPGVADPKGADGVGFELEPALSEITSLKRQISALGPVNLDAIEQSREQQSRFDEYSTQVADLTTACADLEKVIRDLSQEMETKFRDAFQKINHNFGVVFKELFGGGHARLQLVPIEGKEDWLNSGIDIIAEPPGKKLANISLLSGGEKALTAIAILFAILKLRPMPFCLLDEIEAALDEANVGRFANYLSKFSTTTQFIVITHRKPTMELADNLYGVTMEEKGVSKIISVKLEAWNDDTQTAPESAERVAVELPQREVTA